MRIGVTLPLDDADSPGTVGTWPEIRAVALAAEAAGFDSAWGYDHLLFRDDDGETGIHEVWTILSALAAATTTLRLGILVVCTGFRNAAMLAKMAGTLDHVSDGRFVLGLGCGWHDPEFEAFGYPTDHKVGRFEESLTVIHGLLRGERVTFDGRWVQARDAVLLPPARPDLPILIAAKGPRMLELTARYADVWNEAWFGMPDERWAGLNRDLTAACQAVGRDPATLERTVGVNVRIESLLPAGREPGTGNALTGDATAIADGIRAYAAEGVSELIAALEPCTPAAVAAFAEAVAVARERGLD